MNTKTFHAVEAGSPLSTACHDPTGPPPDNVFLSVGTGPLPFEAIVHLLSEKPLRRPNRTRLSKTPASRTVAERLVPSREDLRKLRDALPFPTEWHEENEKPF